MIKLGSIKQFSQFLGQNKAPKVTMTIASLYLTKNDFSNQSAFKSISKKYADIQYLKGKCHFQSSPGVSLCAYTRYPETRWCCLQVEGSPLAQYTHIKVQ